MSYNYGMDDWLIGTGDEGKCDWVSFSVVPL